MNPERWRQLEEIFHGLLAVTGPERPRVLDERCGDDVELRREVVALLASADAEADADSAISAIVVGAADQLARHQHMAAVGRRLGPYRLVSLLGAGGMGAVYLAERADAEFTQQVAIKIVAHAAGSPQAVSRFRDERQILAALDHPNIVRLLDGGSTDDDLPYLVMELIVGQPITGYAQAHALSVRARLDLVRQVCTAVQYAHQHLVIHRDVKPSNILVDATGCPKLLDFGIAKLVAPLAGFDRSGATRTGIAPFTPEYASPEQARGAAVSTATDVYSLGAVLYELLTDQPPHRAAASLLEMIRVIGEVEPVRPSLAAPPERRRELMGDLDNIVMKALQIDPARRYASIEQLADDLGRHLDGLPVVARTATVTYRAGKFVRRHRAGVVAATLLVIGLTAATGFSVREARRADRQAERAEAQRCTLLVENGRRELAAGHSGRALSYLAAALGAGADTPAVRVLLGAAMRPYQALIASVPSADGITNAAWSPDGTRLATTTMRSRGGLYDRDGRLLARLNGEGAVDSMPTFAGDGRLVAAADFAGRVLVWDAVTGERRRSLQVAPPPKAPEISEVRLVFVDGSAGLATVAADHRLALWEPSSGAQLASTDLGCEAHALAVSPDAATLATGCVDGVVALHDTHTLARRIELGGAAAAIGYLAFSPSGTRVYGVAGDTILAWDPRATAPLARFHGNAFALSPDGARVLAWDEDGIGRIYDAATGALLAALMGHERGGLSSLDWSQDGTLIATSGPDGSFRTWDATTGEPRTVMETANGGGRATNAPPGALTARFAPDGARLLTVAGTGMSIWRVERGALLESIATGGVLWSAAWSPDERRVAFGGDNRGGIVGNDRSSITIPVAGGSWIFDVNWSPDGGRLVIGSRGGIVRIVNGDGVLVDSLVGHTASVYRVSFSPDGRWLATASGDHTARIWDAATGQVRRVLPHRGAVMAAAWSRDGTRLATADGDSHLLVWDVTTGTPAIDLYGEGVQYLDVTISPDGRSLVATGHGGEVEVWDLTRRRRRMVLVGHASMVTNAVWSPDGALIATASSDHSARIWDPVTGAELARFHHPSDVMSLQWSHDGARILAGCNDGVARVWDVHRAGGTPAEIGAFVTAHLGPGSGP